MGDMVVHGIGFFSSGISVFLVLMCGIAVPRGIRFCILLVNGIR